MQDQQGQQDRRSRGYSDQQRDLPRHGGQGQDYSPQGGSQRGFQRGQERRQESRESGAEFGQQSQGQRGQQYEDQQGRPQAGERAQQSGGSGQGGGGGQGETGSTPDQHRSENRSGGDLEHQQHGQRAESGHWTEDPDFGREYESPNDRESRRADSRGSPGRTRDRNRQRDQPTTTDRVGPSSQGLPGGGEERQQTQQDDGDMSNRRHVHENDPTADDEERGGGRPRDR
ncbi:hypothetical protein [Haloterrigena alkaliphila]|uniref:Uncharacterized protein n=1 Tax=Haloterrigena alkaliphila TaxID=2816475 RepID=A0A8A2VH75_9EURY|nr:hypothetical protein [Haloterrigena alkaliphila]QSX00018.1 hypothetical protein J0X25_03365 [Haloterrigena alkaliphila]